MAPLCPKESYKMLTEMCYLQVAMLAAVGILTVELQGKSHWWDIPAQLPHGGLEYIVPVIGIHLVFAFAEKTRIENFGELLPCIASASANNGTSSS